MIKRSALLFLLFAMPTNATDTYVAQDSAGNTGANCANARLFSHAIGDDVAGKILHLCRTIALSNNRNGFTALACSALRACA